MVDLTLEERVAALEKAVEELKKPLWTRSNWLDHLPRIQMSTEEWAEYEAICKYIRQTGDGPPPGWKPGDPIPEPEWWGDDVIEREHQMASKATSTRSGL